MKSNSNILTHQNNNKRFIYRIPKHFWFLLVLITLGLLTIFISITCNFDITMVKIPWGKKGDFLNPVHLFFLLLPFILLFFIFISRKKLSSIKLEHKFFIWITLGVMVIFWELWFDVTSIKNEVNDGHALSYAMFHQFISGFLYCRMNMYIVGTFLVLRKTEMLKWVAGTAFFGGLTVIFDSFSGEADIHSLFTHAIFLCVVPFLAITMNKGNYAVKNLIHSVMFNLFLVMVMLVVNVWINGGLTTNPNKYGFASFAGELTKDRMAINAMVGWSAWPMNIILWILLVVLLELIVFFVFRLVNWKTYNKKMTYAETFTTEYKRDISEWYGFKFWGKNNWFKRYVVNLKARWR